MTNATAFFAHKTVQFPDATQLLASKVAQAEARPNVVNAADEMRAVYHTVTRTAISLTEQQVRHYATILSRLMHKVETQENTKRKLLSSDMLNLDEENNFDVLAHLSEKEAQEFEATSKLLVRAVMPFVGYVAFKYAERYSSVGAAFSAAYLETLLGVCSYRPVAFKENGTEEARAMKLTAFLEDRLIKKGRMDRRLQDDDNNRKAQERAGLMMSYLATLELDFYDQHDPEVILERIAEEIFMGKYRKTQVINGQEVPIVLKEGEQYPLNPAFLEQHFNTVKKVEQGLKDIYFYKPLSLNYSTDSSKGTLEDTMFGYDERKLDTVDMVQDLQNILVLLADQGFDETRIEEMQLANFMVPALQHRNNVGYLIPNMVEVLDITADEATMLLRYFVPFYRKYKDVLDIEDIELPEEE